MDIFNQSQINMNFDQASAKANLIVKFQNIMEYHINHT